MEFQNKTSRSYPLFDVDDDDDEKEEDDEDDDVYEVCEPSLFSLDINTPSSKSKS